MTKRALDLGLGTALLVISLPLLAALGLLTLASGRPVLFRQARVGRDGETFEVLKFRTMYQDSDVRLTTDEALWKQYVDNDFKLAASDDPRVTRIGKLLRRSSLDELPQLINVLRGDMSLVGPRPVVPAELAMYGPFADAYMAVRPGITGRWQTEGRNTIRYPERAHLDAAYVEQYRVRDDLRILWRTVPAVLVRSGVR
jgi:lipopolysaccharide/colanic/teichoic acid biosynthesis glycosyltransferase